MELVVHYCKNGNKYECEIIEELIVCNVDAVRETFIYIKLRSSVGSCMQLLMRNGCMLAVIN